MKKAETEMEDELRPEYDLSTLRVRKLGPSRKMFGEVVRLEPTWPKHSRTRTR